MSARQVYVVKTCTNTDANHNCVYTHTDENEVTTDYSNIEFDGIAAYRASTSTDPDARYHIYFEPDQAAKYLSLSKEYNQYHTTTINVAEAGVYDFCFRVRHKGEGDKGITREVQIQVNGQAYGEQNTLRYSISDSFTNNGKVSGASSSEATYCDSYLTGFSAALKAGENTITFRFTGADKDIHIRDFYIVKAEIPVETNKIIYTDEAFSATQPNALTNPTATVITIEGAGCIGTNTIQTVRPTDSKVTELVTWNDVGEASAHGAIRYYTSGLYHYYMDYSISSGVNALNVNAEGKAYMRWSFEVTTEGTYELYFNLRLKNNGERHAIMQLDRQVTTEQYWLKMTPTKGEVAAGQEGALKDAKENTYLTTGITLELSAGTHTLTFRLPSGTNASFHFRNLYLVKTEPAAE